MEEAWISAGSMMMLALLARSSVGTGGEKEVEGQQKLENYCFIQLV